MRACQRFHAPSTLTPQGAQALGAAFNKKYGLNVKLQYSPSGNMTRDIGKVVGLGASGVPPEWDLMVVTDAHHATLWVKKMHQPFDYKSIGVDAKAVQYDNGSVSFANQFVLPAYNKQLVQAKDQRIAVLEQQVEEQRHQAADLAARLARIEATLAP